MIIVNTSDDEQTLSSGSRTSQQPDGLLRILNGANGKILN